MLDSNPLLWKQSDVLHTPSTPDADPVLKASGIATVEEMKKELYPMRGQEFLVQGLHDLCAFVSQSLA